MTHTIIRAIGVSHTACKDEFRQNLRSHSWSVFSFINIYIYMCLPVDTTIIVCCGLRHRISVQYGDKKHALLYLCSIPPTNVTPAGMRWCYNHVPCAPSIPCSVHLDSVVYLVVLGPGGFAHDVHRHRHEVTIDLDSIELTGVGFNRTKRNFTLISLT